MTRGQGEGLQRVAADAVEGAARPGDGGAHASPARQVTLVPLIAGRGGIEDALPRHLVHGLGDKAVVEERRVGVADVVDDNLGAGARQLLDAAGEILR